MEVDRVPKPSLIGLGETIHTISFVYPGEIPVVSRGLGVKVELNYSDPGRLVCYIISPDMSSFSGVDIFACPLDLGNRGSNLSYFAVATQRRFGQSYLEVAYNQAAIVIQRDLGLPLDYSVAVYPDESKRIGGVKGLVFFHNRVFNSVRSLVAQRVQGIFNAAASLQAVIGEELLSVAIPMERFSPEKYLDSHFLRQSLLGFANFCVGNSTSGMRTLFLLRRVPLSIKEAARFYNALFQVLDDVPDMDFLLDVI